MQLVLTGLGLISLVELLLWWRPIWQARRYIVPAIMAGMAIGSGALLGQNLSLWTLILCLLSVYRIINLLRVRAGRIHEDYLYFASRRTSWWLVGSQLAAAIVTVFIAQQSVSILSLMSALALILVLACFIILVTTLRHLKTTLPPPIKSGIADRDLPSLTVAIPARNETEDLELCLASLIASSYPKLEILVLDDCSQNKRTPEIIRDFAHDGVRFIAGTQPPGQWLAKNHAYAQLAAESNGELLLFCGVDARFQPDSLTNLVKTMLQKQKSMISILPANVLPMPRRPLSLCVQPGRYAWEICLPRRVLDRAPVLSTCWIISRQVLQSAGGFAAVTRNCVPESYFARYSSRTDDGYSFMQANASIGIGCVKTLDEQRSTAIRMRYPQMHRRMEVVALISFLEFVLLVWPIILLLAAVISQTWPLVVIALLINTINFYTYSRIVNMTYRQFYWPGIFILPIAAIYDIGVLHYSMWQYEFSEVLWKGRNVCVPIMRIYASLPPLPTPTANVNLARKP